jgi:hypothetical protein
MATIRVPLPRPQLEAVWVEQSGRFVVAPASGPRVEINKAGSILLIVGIAGVMSSVLYLLWTSKLQSLSAT